MIYQWIYADKAEGGDLSTHLRIALKPNRNNDRRGKLRNSVDIYERPSIVDRRSRIVDWEGDTFLGMGCRSALLTMGERKTRYTIIVQQAGLLADAAIEAMAGLKDRIKTINLVNGFEFAEHERIADAFEAKVYFDHHYASLERGINQNANGLIRQYVPKGTNLNEVTDEEIQKVMDKLNGRPRRTIDC